MQTQAEPHTASSESLRGELRAIVSQGRLQPHYQPIVNLRSGEVLGYEALIRGPSDGYLHSPVALFDAAQRCGLLVEVERCALRMVTRRFVELGLPGRLFVNVSADVLLSGLEQRWRQIQDEIQAIGLPPSRVVVELTETRPVEDYARLRRIFTMLRSAGFALAIDDLGEGFASLRRWVELRPGYVKIDRYFVEALHRDPLKQQFVRALAAIASEAEAQVVAEGIESPDELRVLQDLGFTIGQGYLFGRPQPAPAAALGTGLTTSLFRRRNALTTPTPLSRGTRLAGALAQPVPTVTAATSCATVCELFQQNPRLNCIPVLDTDSRPVGLLRRLDTMERMSKPYMRELYGRRPCTSLMADASLVFDAGTTLQTMSEAVVATDARHYTDGFVVTQGGQFTGMGSIADLMRAITEIQIHTARYANPLTLLPGNVPIHDYVDTLIEGEESFIVAYFDLDNFKPFNDIYGYRRGDDLIQFTAQILAAACDSERDFLGHIGGDDFVVVFRSLDWEARVAEALAQFDRAAGSFFSEAHRKAGGYLASDRQGREVFHSLVTLSAGLVPVSPGSHDSHVSVAAVAAEVKRVAKGIPGSAYFVDRRQTVGPDLVDQLN